MLLNWHSVLSTSACELVLLVLLALLLLQEPMAIIANAKKARKNCFIVIVGFEWIIACKVNDFFGTAISWGIKKRNPRLTSGIA
jgi:hypothetical protein